MMMTGKTVLWLLLLATFLVVSPVAVPTKVFAQQQEQVNTGSHSELREIPVGSDSTFMQHVTRTFENQQRVVDVSNITGSNDYETWVQVTRAIDHDGELATNLVIRIPGEESDTC
jgi:hypothetical protein